MKSKFYTSLFGGAVLALILPLTALAGDPIPGVDIALEQNPGGIIVGRGETDAKGTVVFPDLKPGNYSAAINTTRDNIPKPSIVVSVEFSGGAKPVKVSYDLAKGRTVKIRFTVPPGPTQRAMVKITRRRSSDS